MATTKKPILTPAEIDMLPYLSFEELRELFDEDEPEPTGYDRVLEELVGKKKKQNNGEYDSGLIVIDFTRVVSFSQEYVEALEANCVSVFMEGSHVHLLRVELHEFTMRLVTARRALGLANVGALLLSSN